MGQNESRKTGVKPGETNFWEVIQKTVRDAEVEKGGILRITERDASGRWKTIQDAHNANHALTHFSFMMFRVFINKGSKNNQECKDRIIAHLSCLREFIGSEEPEVMKAVYTILQAIQNQPMASLRDWGGFILSNWKDIRILAARYSDPNRCFSESDYEKLSQILEKKEE